MNPEIKAKLSLRLKQNLFVRIMSYPLINLKKERLKRKFFKSEHGKYLRTLKDKYKGKRCFIIGNGPSLNITDLDKLSNEYSFAPNKILYLLNHTIWKPTFYLCADLDGYTMVKDELKKYPDLNTFVDIRCKGRTSKTTHFFYSYGKYHINRYRVDDIHISEDISKYVYTGYTVTFTAIQLAVYMGFKEIYLLGCDHNYAVKVDSHGHKTVDNSIQTYAKGIPDWGKSIQNIDITTRAYQCAKEYCNKQGIKIYNATRGGMLEVFERVNLDDILN